MNIPGRSSESVRGYLQTSHDSVPLPLPVKGEYIEEYDEIKVERLESTTPLPRPLYPPRPPPPLMMSTVPHQQTTTFANSLSPMELISKLSNYASSARKRGPAIVPTDLTSPAKKFQPQQVVPTPRIEKVVSLSSSGTPQSIRLSPTEVDEPNNNTEKEVTDPCLEIPDVTQPQKSMIDCPVCGDIAVAHFHYGGMCCYSCKAFFRRVVNTNKVSLRFGELLQMEELGRFH